jgi:hypothetical protein
MGVCTKVLYDNFRVENFDTPRNFLLRTLYFDIEIFLNITGLTRVRDSQFDHMWIGDCIHVSFRSDHSQDPTMTLITICGLPIFGTDFQ